MTTTTERLDRATFQRRWTDDLAAAHTEARDKWAKAAAESAGELRAFADFLHELDVPGLVAMADDLATERLSETAEWPAWAELDFAELVETPNRPSQIRHTHDTDAGGNCRHPNCGFNSDELHFEFDDDGPRYELALVQRRTRVIQPTSVIPAEPDPVQAYWDADDSDDLPGRPVLLPTRNPLAQAYARTAALARQRKTHAPNYPDTPEQIADQEATARALTEGQRKAQGWTPTRPWHRRAWGATKRAVLRVDAWAERIGEDKK